jgi:CheY-like chemotaxis protein
MRAHSFPAMLPSSKPAGARVLEARDGVEAIAMIELRDDVAALFTDVTMPNMNGIALAHVVGARWPHIGNVVTSGALPPNVKLELPQGARFLAKPSSKQLLQEFKPCCPRSVRLSRSRASQPCSPARCTAQVALPNLCQSQPSRGEPAELNRDLRQPGASTEPPGN